MEKESYTNLTLGPVLFNWAPECWRDFYFRMADEAPVDTVCVGEVVCSKRAQFFAPYLTDVVERLLSAGKEVVLSTLALIMNEREIALVREIVENTDFLVEANDISAAALLKGRPHAIGPFVNIYNEDTLAYMVHNGARRVTLPVELSASSIATLTKSVPAELEVMVFGRLPLAISARCYHARCHNLSRDNCQFVCEKNPDGLDVDTLNGEPFLAINGVQTMSHTYCNLIGDLSALLDLGVGRFRLSPHSVDMVRVAKAFRAVLESRMAPEEANTIITEETGSMPISNGYFHGRTGATFEGIPADQTEAR